MQITILHSKACGASRDIMTVLGLPTDAVDANVVMGGYTIHVIGDHAQAVDICPNFADYPVLIVQDGELVRVKAPVASWTDCLDFIETPQTTPAETRFTRTGFKRLFTLDEFDALLIARMTVPTGPDDPAVDVIRMWEFLSGSDFVSLTDPLTVNSLYLLVLGGYITEERFEEIKLGVVQIPGEDS